MFSFFVEKKVDIEIFDTLFFYETLKSILNSKDTRIEFVIQMIISKNINIFKENRRHNYIPMYSKIEKFY